MRNKILLSNKVKGITLVGKEDGRETKERKKHREAGRSLKETEASQNNSRLDTM